MGAQSDRGGGGDRRDVAFPARTDAAVTVDEHHRLFDAARIRLWVGEESGDQALLGAARERFEELGALPFDARASAAVHVHSARAPDARGSSTG